ncbi:MAG: LacI family DNA-binding transcriptional regulator [Bacteroidetes bacterium]|nr:LacI family DNA-binding transcriptional regulator [Bacteroidota bacterium]
MKRLQLEDLSKQLGYSKTLISMVLNGKGNQYGISKKTQEAVLNAVAQLDYTPNKFARALRTGKSFFIGLIVADLGNTFYSTIAKSVESALFDKGYNLMVCSTEEDENREKKLVEIMFNQQGVDGIIVATSFKNAEFYADPRFAKSSIVLIDRILPLFNSHYVIIDNYDGSLEITNKLINEGCKNIFCLAITPSHLSTIEDRVNGYKDAMSKNNLDTSNHVFPINFAHTQCDVQKFLQQIMDTHQKPDAIYCLNNSIVIKLLNLLRQKEYEKYFAKTKIACFDNIELFDLIDRKVISISQPVNDIGLISANLLLDVIDGKQTAKSNVVLPIQLINR